jgi:activator of 2-hydroxyglutaryl-CoA dehydratase
MARRLGLTLEEISGLTVSVGKELPVSDGCVVFGEMDALSLLNRGAAPAAVAGAVVAAAVIRVCTVINDITEPALESVALFGGLANNAAFVGALKNRTGIDFYIPADPEYAGAIGAALCAAGWGGDIFGTPQWEA